jgi:predicted TIM-barrel enzyme
MGYALEVDMIAQARELELLTTPYVFSEDDASAMARRAPTSSCATWG